MENQANVPNEGKAQEISSGTEFCGINKEPNTGQMALNTRTQGYVEKQSCYWANY